MLAYLQRHMQFWIDRTLPQASREHERKIARGRKHLSGAWKIKIALLVSRQPDGIAVFSVTLHGAIEKIRSHNRLVVVTTLRHQCRQHAERGSDIALDQFGDRAAIPTFQDQLQEDITGMRINSLPAGQPRRMIGRQQKS
jgi:hypothetical protein